MRLTAGTLYAAVLRRAYGDLADAVGGVPPVGLHRRLRQVCISAIDRIDARAAERFRGDVEPLDARAGHVPGARNRPFGANLANGRFLPRHALREQFEPLLGGLPPTRAILSCGSGVTACHNLLAMEHAGLHGARIYAGSWSGWIADPARPIAVGD